MTQEQSISRILTNQTLSRIVLEGKLICKQNDGTIGQQESKHSTRNSLPKKIASYL